MLGMVANGPFKVGAQIYLQRILKTLRKEGYNTNP